MVFFGHRHQSKDETALARKARNPYAPNPSPPRRNRNQQLVDADGDLDALCRQEIERYEELFDSSNHGAAFAGPGDDDTLQDGSIYTSTQTLQGPSASLRPSSFRNISPSPSFGEPEDESLWGLQDPYKLAVKPAPTSLLTPKEEAAAARLASMKKQKKASEASSKPALSKVPVAPKTTGQATRVEFRRFPDAAAAAAAAPPVTKKDKKKNMFSPKRLFRGAERGASTSKLPPSTSYNNKQQQQQATNDKTPETQASTPASASKKKFFSPARIFQKNSSHNHNNKKQHPNLLLASFTAVGNNSNNNANRSNSNKNKPLKQQQPPSPPMNVKCNSPPFFPPYTESPPPPIENFEACSVSSAQSSLTDALDAWMISNSPPKIVGGDHLQKCSPNRLEAYEGGLSPYRWNDNDNDDGDDDDDNADEYSDDDDDDDDIGMGIEDEEKVLQDEYYTSSPAATRLTEEGLYYHNTHRSNQNESMEQEESSLYRAIKEHRWKRMEQKALLHQEDDASAVEDEEADMHVVKILGLQDCDEAKSADNSVKRNLFGNDEEGVVAASENSAPSQVETKAKKEQPAEEVALALEHKKNTTSKAKQSDAPPPQHPKKMKSPRFRKLISKIVHGGNKDVSEKKGKATDQYLEAGQARAPNKEAKQGKMEHDQGGGRQNKVDSDNIRVGSVSLMTGDMKNRAPVGSTSSFTVEETSHPTSSNTGSRPETPTLAPTLCLHCQTNDRTHIVLPCMHYTLCDECVEQARGYSSSDCHCHSCNTMGFLYARVGVLEGQELQEKLLQQSTQHKAEETLQALAFQ